MQSEAGRDDKVAHERRVSVPEIMKQETLECIAVVCHVAIVDLGQKEIIMAHA